MHYVTRDALRHDLVLRIKLFLLSAILDTCWPLKFSSCFRSSLDNIPPILSHGDSDPELTFNSDYCCRRFLVEPSRTSLFFEQYLLPYSSVVTVCYRVLSGNCCQADSTLSCVKLIAVRPPSSFHLEGNV